MTDKNNIKSSLLRRIITVPRLPEYALNTYDDTDSTVAGVIEVTIPNETYQPITVLRGSGVFTFGGIEISDEGVSITKVIIDDTVVFDSSISGSVLKRVFSNDGTGIGRIASNTTPYLINEYIEIQAINENRKRWRDRSASIYIALVPIE
jgi:hypothetical protein